MEPLQYTLLTDGSSDRALQNILDWALRQQLPTKPISGSYADFSGMKKPPKVGEVASRIQTAKELYDFNLLFYHRDAEDTDRTILDKRKKEVLDNIPPDVTTPVVCVVPIKMMETWLLIDQEAILKAAGNRNYKGRLDIPKLQQLEYEKDPKGKLYDNLRTASGLTGRRLARFDHHAAVHYVASYIEDFSPLRQLHAFRMFESDLTAALSHLSLA